ncbi:MAG TPA: phospholipase D-like domain-containing protein [Acetobacteraceae bacterium]|nr:phospholipase D-like domain-containing protein [Acetobacteraceae bacterium]
MTETLSAPILRPGDTCWKTARAERMAVIIDGAEYFKALKKAILGARHSVLMIGWDFNTSIELERDGCDPSVPNVLGDFLSYAVKRNPRLHVHLLRWDLAFLKMPWRGTTPFLLLDWLTSRRIHFRLDGNHPSGGCHHQKIVVIDDALAFCGGIDATMHRWDTPEHRDGDTRRHEANGVLYGPWHDATTAVDGEAARVLGELARARWQAATGKLLEPPPPVAPEWPDNLDPAFRDVDVAIARTWPRHEGPRGEEVAEIREIERLYLAAIAAARRSIYLESQYFAAPKISAAIEARLSEPLGPEIIIVNPRRADGWLEEEAMGPARALLLRRLQRADRFGHLRFVTPVTEQGADIYVHAKVLVIDDRLLRVGSSNINNRSLGLDTECDLAIEVSEHDAERDDIRAAILAVRDALLAEHLGVPVAELRRSLAETSSLTVTFDRLAKPSGRTLKPFEPPAVNDVEHVLARTGALDPDAPEKMTANFIRAIRLLALPWPKQVASWLTPARKTL